MGLFSENTNSGRPVSYTHLDVYKRQVPEWLEADAENLRGTVKELPNREAIDVRCV